MDNDAVNDNDTAVYFELFRALIVHIKILRIHFYQSVILIYKMLLIYATLIMAAVEGLLDNVTMTPSFDEDDTPVKILSRRKRFIIFPDGSSVQLVFCTQNHGYLQIGNIVWFGNTAALAWELPTDPEIFNMFKDHTKLYKAQRKSDVIYYMNEKGKIIGSQKYKRKIIVNPAFAKRSVDTIKNNTIKPKLYIKKMHNLQKNKNVLEELDATRIHFYRKERQKLYVKLEKFLQTLGWDGEECVLRMLCESAKNVNVQGTFVEEVLRAVFTLPKDHVLSEVRNQYDEAHGANGDCASLYPNCRHNT